MRLHHLIPSGWFKFLGNLSELSGWIATHKTQSHHDFYTFGFDYTKREELYEYVVQSQSLEQNIDYLEFGVSRGTSFKWWIARIKDRNSRFYGFDTFTGLPEDWGPFKKGAMNNGNAPPSIDDDRHSFYQGLFQQTLIPFLSSYKPNARRVIHMDADLYSSTLYVLTLFTPYLKPGDIILFDEFNVPMHEFKAFTEWTKAFYIDYKVLGGVNNFYQTAIIIT